MSGWTRDKALKNSSPSYPHSPLANAAMALNLTNSFLQLQRPSSLAVAPPKNKESGARTHRPVVTCRKKDLHPQFYEDSKVYCNGELVMTTGGTQKEYSVDVWSGNHPFYLGSRSALLVDADQVEKFRKKFGELSQLMEIPVLKGEIVLPTKKKSGKGKKK
ncbi:50S ribosomal protein L31, chloroplastic [Benincasa hispida]|uniref:50S ribosomal protein L31, chloroplastic n=1 Tax=Benincasa hispida TaxID=102211 RepID=UPI001900F634|nr:50S ribosomal protein L31, chloroplastic [Benincasa hispida]XP_038896267.1 50S ribosomal protein L31, chloroplastic [Benincasa hispida]